MTLAKRFVDSALRVPTNRALVVDGRQVTFAELLGLASALRTRFDSLADPAARVALLCPHSLEHYTGALAAVLSSRSFLPLRPEDPEERLLRILEEAAPSVLVCSDETETLGDRLAQLLDHRPEVVVPEESSAPLTEIASMAATSEAYLMYTSGSTGRPKGVPISTGNAEAVLAWAEDHYDIDEADRFAQTFEPSFDLWAFTTFVAWNAGAAVVDLPPRDRLGPKALLEREGVTVWFSTPTHARLIRQLRGLAPNSFPSLRWSLFCGEPLAMADAVDWQAAAPNSRIENLYGPTEVTQVCSSYRFSHPVHVLEPDRGTWAPIGEVFAHLSHVVVDETGAPVDPGQDGELWIAGSQVFDGYLLRPDEDAKSFATVTAPDGQLRRYYRTGDIVRSDRRGRLRFVGRRDSQVKVMGHRIELGELEARALSCAGVEGAVAITFRDAHSPFQQIALTLVGEPGVGELVEKELMRTLPNHMQPRRILELDTLPTTSSGKIDRRSLAAMAGRVQV